MVVIFSWQFHTLALKRNQPRLPKCRLGTARKKVPGLMWMMPVGGRCSKATGAAQVAVLKQSAGNQGHSSCLKGPEGEGNRHYRWQNRWLMDLFKMKIPVKTVS